MTAAGSRLFDASSVVDLVLGEGGSDVGIDVVFDEHVLDLTTYEAANAIWGIGVADDRLTDAQIADALEILRRLGREVRIETATGDELEGTMAVARDTGLTFYDAAYLATAERKDLTLVTEDESLAEAAAGLDVDVVSITDA